MPVSCDQPPTLWSISAFIILLWLTQSNFTPGNARRFYSSNEDISNRKGLGIAKFFSVHIELFNFTLAKTGQFTLTPDHFTRHGGGGGGASRTGKGTEIH